MTKLPFTVLSHTADTGIEATASPCAELVDELAAGMFALMVSIDPCPSTDHVEVEVKATSPENLLVQVLSELLYESETRDIMLCGFETTMLGPAHARTTASGTPFPDVETRGPPIKAVTYHDVALEDTGDHWFGRVYFDV